MLNFEFDGFLVGEGSFILIWESGQYEEREARGERFPTKTALIDKVNQLQAESLKYTTGIGNPNMDDPKISILFAGEIRKEFRFEPVQLVEKFRIKNEG